jgi:peptidoglycan/LPS O-acetylase OafA/YrhL
MCCGGGLDVPSSVVVGRAVDRQSNNFDLLRLLAAWFVLFSHCYPIAGLKLGDPFSRAVGIDTFGGVGVAIFFVLSGYLVTLSWQRSSGIGSFLWKRTRRIYPALIVCVLICVVVIGPLLTSLDAAAYFTHSQTRDYLRTASAWRIHYVLPAVFANNPVPNAVNGSLWSLPYEIRCYLALMLIGVLPFALRFKVLAVAVVLATMLLLRESSPPASPFDHRFGLDYYMVKLGLFFAIGASYACWQHRVRPVWWVGLIATGLTLWLPDSSLRNLLWILSFSTLTLGVALDMSWLPKLPAKMGDWSYGLYLYAFPLQQVLALFAVQQTFGFVGYVVLSTLCSLLAAALSWFLIEKPALSLEWQFWRPRVV